MPLQTVCRTYDQHRIIQHLQRPLHFRGEIYMSRRIQQRDIHPLPLHLRLFGKDGNAPVTLLHVGVQKGISVIHPPQPADLPACIQNTLRQRRFPGIYMGQETYTYMLMLCRFLGLLFLRLFAHKIAPPFVTCSI